jgi:hypothetical protein
VSVPDPRGLVRARKAAKGDQSAPALQKEFFDRVKE